MNSYYENGATHNDNHKEINIYNSITSDGLQKLATAFFADAQDAEIIPITTNDTKDFSLFDENAEAKLREDNEIFVTTLPTGEEISLCKLKLFIDSSFIPRAEVKHNWVSLWQLLKNKTLLQTGKRDYHSFVQQMNKTAYYNSIDPSIACTLDGMRYYANVDYYTPDEWDNILDKAKDKRKTNKSGLLEIKKLYKQLEKEFKIEVILR